MPASRPVSINMFVYLFALSFSFSLTAGFGLSLSSRFNFISRFCYRRYCRKCWEYRISQRYNFHICDQSEVRTNFQCDVYFTLFMVFFSCYFLRCCFPILSDSSLSISNLKRFVRLRWTGLFPIKSYAITLSLRLLKFCYLLIDRSFLKRFGYISYLARLSSALFSSQCVIRFFLANHEWG